MEKSTRHASNTPNERAGDRPDIVFPLLALKFATTTYGGRKQAVHDDGHANVFVLPPRTKSFFFEYRSPPLYSFQIDRNFPRAPPIFSYLIIARSFPEKIPILAIILPYLEYQE